MMNMPIPCEPAMTRVKAASGARAMNRNCITVINGNMFLRNMLAVEALVMLKLFCAVLRMVQYEGMMTGEFSPTPPLCPCCHPADKAQPR